MCINVRSLLLLLLVITVQASFCKAYCMDTKPSVMALGAVLNSLEVASPPKELSFQILANLYNAIGCKKESLEYIFKVKENLRVVAFAPLYFRWSEKLEDFTSINDKPESVLTQNASHNYRQKHHKTKRSNGHHNSPTTIIAGVSHRSPRHID